MPSFIDLSGRTFNRLTVLKRAKNDSCNFVRWFCRCECGNEIAVRSAALRDGQTRSCGCWKSELQRVLIVERTKTHGHATKSKRSKTYVAWVNMIQRCTNPKATKYESYGGRGIKVCRRWRISFENFLADMGQPPSPEHSIDRKNNARDYKPSNCRWAIEEIQMNNRSKSRVLKHGGRSMTIEQWARETGIPHRTIGNRIDRLGWSISEALSIEPSPMARNKR